VANDRICEDAAMKLLPAIVLLIALNAFAAESHALWQIGKPDHDNAEFALAPGGYAQYKDDASYIVGHSDSKHDWPFAQPGPSNGWGNSRQHVFTILFGVKAPVADGKCRLQIDLIDAQDIGSELRIEVNGRAFERTVPAGESGDAIYGDVTHGKPRQVVVEFPASLLLAGNNQIAITTVEGGWLMYDCVTLETPAEIQPAPVARSLSLRSIQPVPALLDRGGKFFEPVNVTVFNSGDPLQVSVQLNGVEAARMQLTNGVQSIEVLAPEVNQETQAALAIVAGGKTLASQSITLKPVRHRQVYILMHSHTDIGYTDLQPNIEKKQAHNVIHALELIRQTKDFPPGSRFKWNLEVMWTADQFYRIATPQQKKEFEEAVRDGNIGVDAMYGNLLTGLCRPEEMMRQISFATDIGRRCGVTVDSMMISDVPGLTWGIVAALAQHGVKYISDGPNSNDRIGYVRVQYENHPFYWESPSGKERALYWGAQGGYSVGHGYTSLLEGLMPLLKRLDEQNYTYDMVQLRWTKGDNGPPDEGVMTAVRDWNKKYAWPKLIIATTSEAFHAFEKRYGDQLPSMRGDMTPYWEDGAGSSARETAINRHTVDRLVQAETIWALRNPRKFPAEEFAVAWKYAAMYSEHTWGAHNSISQPDLPFVTKQWKYKQDYALNAEKESHELLDKALGSKQSVVADSVDVYNTASWPRMELVTLAKGISGNVVTDEHGNAMPSQRLSTGELVFLAKDVPPLGAKRFAISAGAPAADGKASVSGTTLSTPLLTVKLDEKTGDIVSLKTPRSETEFAGGSINQYLYLPGGNTNKVQFAGPAKISVKESGPLVVSLLVESDAPGCNRLSREVRLVDGMDRVEIIDLVDKKAVRSVEGVHFGFDFNVVNPVVHINSPGVIGETEKDQLPGACRNWYSVERWTDISNDKLGVTWSTTDVPLMEMGGLTANLVRSQPNPNVYLKTNPPSSKIYSWVMNNHWHTNFRADQDGATEFRYAIRLHGAYDPVAATRFGLESTEPLIVAPASGSAPIVPPLTIESAGIIVTAFKPSDDGKAFIVRLWNPTDETQTAHLNWNRPIRGMWFSSGLEERGAEAPPTVELPISGVMTLRVEQ
jgi:hypothetical protein